jgi:hypothetical protein
MISARLTRNVGPQATASAIASEIQKSASPRPASIAPGQRRRTALSTISIVAMESVSATRAIPTAAPSAVPARRSGIMLSR